MVGIEGQGSDRDRGVEGRGVAGVMGKGRDKGRGEEEGSGRVRGGEES